MKNRRATFFFKKKPHDRYFVGTLSSYYLYARPGHSFFYSYPLLYALTHPSAERHKNSHNNNTSTKLNQKQKQQPVFNKNLIMPEKRPKRITMPGMIYTVSLAGKAAALSKRVLSKSVFTHHLLFLRPR